MSDEPLVTEAKKPWFADRDVLVLMYRINRRPIAQGNFFAEQPEDFLDHLVECLLFGEEIVTTGRGNSRTWILGNSDFSTFTQSLAGWIGFGTEESELRDDYDESTKSWRTGEVTIERRATAPFVVSGVTQLLFIAQHPDFSENVPRHVIERLLEAGEQRREHPTTIWGVEPVLDRGGFQQWLDETNVLEKITFEVRLPNPDGEELFEEVLDHLNKMQAGSFKHTLKPRNPEVGLSKDFTQDSISKQLMAMVQRTYAQIVAKGTGVSGSIRTYNQNRKVKRERVHLPEGHEAATQALVEFGISKTLEDDDDE